MGGFQSLFGTSPAVFIGITLVFMGGCAAMTGQALARTWRPAGQIPLYCLLLGCADRFLTYALFQGRLLLWSGYGIDTLLLMGIALLAFKATRARQMETQYPWLCKRTGWLTWAPRIEGEEP
ncbi:MAG: hypothetical protein F8N37_19030 [Telmatospirillum sp.]|nr:hypothetical protein [Telmatospirillum sp.]